MNCIDRWAALADEATKGQWRAVGTSLVNDTYGFGTLRTTADASFIAAARTAVPELIEAVRKIAALHPSVTTESLDANPDEDEPELPAGDMCPECLLAWPCPTMEILAPLLTEDDR